MLSLRWAALRACAPARRSYVCVLSKDDAEKPAKARAAKAAKGTDEKKAAAKPKALRAPSAFNLFYKVAYADVRKAAPSANFAEASALVRTKWSEASPETRAPFEREAAELKAAVDAKKAEALAAKKANQKPLTAYMLFANKNRSAVAAANPGKPVTEIASLLGKAWKALPAEEQQKYKDEAKANMDAWKAKHGTPSS
ncbi:hypothetical protein GPECTOR_2g1287 [Gonium pectorale]|uniref:HMG box domain-containing protein n=1 Tax=Gonium pectorale TaxID=33097 RepID=A0A150H0P7_GONPE|nr:hypothetical protein GPECTOR_2g1287 [Gonium pectorale]|eukprot:KXZ55737.1 hypothetical protein GPECTOR_2g1287 [Gonium pectorale]